MSTLSDRPLVRWAAPVAAVAVIAGATVLTSRTASADAGLPTVSAQQLLTDLQGAQVDGISGTVRQSVDLGLPQLPGLSGGSGSASDSPALSSIVSGTHTWRVWVAGPTQQRLALIGSLGESDVIRNGADVWAWSSQDQTAVHSTLPALPAHAPGVTSPQLPTDLPKTPAEAAQLALAAVGKTTDVTVAGTAVVAGRPAYELVLKPRDTATRVAQVRIAVDSVTKVPLRVQVYSTKLANPAVDVGFTSVDFSAPAASQFTFTPPPGTTVTEKALPVSVGKPSGTVGAGKHAPSLGATAPQVVGTGWSSVVVAKMPADALTQGGGGQVEGLLAAIPKVSGAWGSGRLVEGTLFSVVLTDDGRIAAGAVAPAQLYAALAAG